MFKERVYNILEDINKKDMNKNTIFENCLKNKLRISLNNYNYDIQQSLSFLMRSNNKRVLKQLVKLTKEKNDD